jgi:hypothetical protein
MNENLKDQDVLLVNDKDNGLRAPNIDKNGEVYAQPLKNNPNPDFLHIQGDNTLQNFFYFFMRQVKNPTEFEFFRLPSWNLKEETQNLQQAIDNPNNPKNSAYIDMHRVEPNEYQNNQQQQQQQQSQQQQQPPPSEQ